MRRISRFCTVRRSLCQPRTASARRGSATVEFAVVAPVFIALILGAIQNGYNIDIKHKLHAVIRQAGRLSSQDYRGRLQAGQTANQKVILDIRNHLKAEGLNGDLFTITITHAEGSLAGTPFDLSDPQNSLKLYRIKVEAPYSAVSENGLFPTPFEKVSASIVFRRSLVFSVEQ